MPKHVIPKTFALASVGGRRRSRGAADITPPSAPVLADPVTGQTSIALLWTSGIDD